MSEATRARKPPEKTALGSMVAVDPESLPFGTKADFSFHYIDISAATNGRLSIPDAPIEYRDAPSRARRVIKTGDVLMSTVRPNLKAFAYCNLPPGNYIASTGFAVLRALGETDSRYVLYAILSDDVSQQINSLTVGSNYPAINSADVRRLKIPAFTPAEQLRIAEILSTLDEAIGQTEALIAKMQQVKTGLMHDLFTRGVTPDGRLRPTREQAPELYKESPLGWIPKEWDFGVLQDVVSPNRPIVYGILMPGAGFPGGIPVIKVKDIVNGEILTENLLLTSPQIDAEYQRSKLRSGDILLTIRGSVGRLAQVSEDLDGANITQDTARIGIVRGVSLFYRYFLETDIPRAHFDINTLGQAVQGINLRDVRTTPVAIPPDIEQQLIAERAESISISLKENTTQGQKLHQKKLGLMHDLLTGSAPVN